MSNMRMTPPDNNTLEPIAVNGRTYKCNVGSTIDVPDFDAGVLEANGWVNTGGPGATVGTTAQRPVRPAKGTKHVDTTVGAVVVYLGTTVGWTHSLSGGTV